MNTILRRRGGRMLLALVLLALAASFAVSPARAAETRGGDTVVIGRGEVVEGDLYVAGSTVTVDGTVNGDLVAVGSMVQVNGTVNGDLLAAGQAVIVNGTVSDDMRVVAQAIQLGPGARVGGDMAVGGLSLETRAGSVVQNDVLVGAYQALLLGSVGRRISGGMDRLELGGTVGGDIDVSIGGGDGNAVTFSPAGQLPMPSVPAGLTLADTAQVGGKLTYHASTPAAVGAQARIGGGTAFDQQQATAQAPSRPVVPGLAYLQRLVALLLVGLLLFWLAPTWARGLAGSVEAKPLPSLAWGFVSFGVVIVALIGLLIVTIVLAAIFGALTLGGLAGMIVGAGMLSFGAVLLGFIAFAAYVAEAIVGYMAGRLVLQRVRPAWAEQPLAPLALGLVLYVLLRAIPWLGGLVALAVVALALGALWMWASARFGRAHPTPAPIGGLQPA